MVVVGSRLACFLDCWDQIDYAPLGVFLRQLQQIHVASVIFRLFELFSNLFFLSAFGRRALRSSDLLAL